MVGYSMRMVLVEKLSCSRWGMREEESWAGKGVEKSQVRRVIKEPWVDGGAEELRAGGRDGGAIGDAGGGVGKEGEHWAMGFMFFFLRDNFIQNFYCNTVKKVVIWLAISFQGYLNYLIGGNIDCQDNLDCHPKSIPNAVIQWSHFKLLTI